MGYTADDINAAIDQVETAKQNHPVGWGMLDEIGLPGDALVSYAFQNATAHMARLYEEKDRRVIYATGWLQGVAIGTALGKRDSP